MTHHNTMNMKKEYRTELKTLARAEKKIKRDFAVAERLITRQFLKDSRYIHRLKAAARENCARSFRALNLSCAPHLARIAKRRAVLEGRLAS